MLEPNQAQQEILRALGTGVVFEHFEAGHLFGFRRSDERPLNEEDMHALQRAGLKDVGYIAWSPFSGQQHPCVGVQLTKVGERWLREHSS